MIVKYEETDGILFVVVVNRNSNGMNSLPRIKAYLIWKKKSLSVMCIYHTLGAMANMHHWRAVVKAKPVSSASLVQH